MSTDRSDITDGSWRWRRREVIIRDEYTCQDCGEVGAHKGDATLEVHHKTPVSEGGTDTPENLVTLCDECHNKRHKPSRTSANSDTNGTRAVLTETEREQIAGEHGDDRKYQATSRARRRIQEELPRDVEILKEHNPDLLDELREVVCDEEAD